MRKYCKLAADGQCDLSWSTSRCSSDILDLPIFAAALLGPPSLLPSGYAAAERAAHITLTPGDKNLRFQNVWNAMAIDEMPRVQSIRQATPCRVSMDVCLETQQCVVWLDSRVTVDAIL